MKRKHFKGMPGFITTIRISCVASIGMMTVQLQAGVTESAPVAEETAELPPNWVDVTVGGAFTSGDKAAYQRRVGQDGDFYGGISDMHLESTVDDITWTLDGHAMFGNEDYELLLGLEKEGLGYIQAGYREFRNWYDGSGGYMPTIPWIDNDDELHVDRGEVWIEAGLRMENLPEMTLGYSHGWRDGMKDSTSWGYSELTNDYHILPSVTDIDEETDTITLDIADAIGGTDYDIGLVYRRVRNQDTRTESYMHDTGAGEEDITVNDTLQYDSDMFNGHLSLTRKFGEKLMASFGYFYTTMDTDISGEREGRTNATDDLYTGAAHGVWGLAGGAQVQMHVLNASVWWNPYESLAIVPSIRAEFTDQSADGWNVESRRNVDVGFDGNTGADPDAVVDNAAAGIWPTGADAGRLEERDNTSSNDWEEITEALEVRYDGVENVLFYGSAEFTQSSGDYFHSTYTDRHINTFTPTTISRWTDSDLDIQKYTLGANWYPLSKLSFSAQAYYREYDQELDSKFAGGTGEDAQIAEHKNETVDLNLRMTWRALPTLTFITRYDYQQTEIDNLGYNNQVKYASSVESADIESHTISETVTWMPISRMYVQGVVSYTMSETDTPANDWVPTSIADSDNDYLMANLAVGYALDQKTDITAGYSYYYSDNYTLPATGVGYGMNLEEHVFSLRLNRWINPNMVWNVGYGYYNSNDGTSGGQNDFDAHMVSTGLQIRF
jgi:hypothetical protein